MEFHNEQASWSVCLVGQFRYSARYGRCSRRSSRQGGFGGGKGGFGGGKGGGLMAPDAFMTKYDSNKDGKVTKEEYLKVSQDDLKTAWEAIDTKKTGTVSTEEYTKYYDDKKAAFGGAGGFPGGGKGGKGGPPMP